jgi:hypothetical protein
MQRRHRPCTNLSHVRGIGWAGINDKTTPGSPLGQL